MIRIAIDGPGGAGKSTIAKKLAEKLNIDYIDTGAMYRAIGLKLLRNGASADDEAAVSALLSETDIDISDKRIFLDGENVSDLIRTQEVSDAASKCSGIKSVREKLVSMQREIAKGKSVVMDGRDIGTNVLKDAELKIFLTADPRVRAERRYKELIARGEEADPETIYQEIVERDYRDTHRELNPLVRADDAILLDTSYMTIDEVVESIINRIEGLE